MDATQLRALQSPLKARYREEPSSAVVRNVVEGRFEGDDVTCTVEGWAGPVVAGLHSSTGGDGSEACSADMLLESLVACAGVTMRSVATAMEIPLTRASIKAEGVWDARGTLGVSRETPIGLTDIKLSFSLESDVAEDKLDKLVELTERYCVIYQTLKAGTQISHERLAVAGE